MKVLTRYWLRAHIGPFFFAFVALTGVILINTLAKELANLAGKGLPLSVVFEFFLLSLPANIALTLPMAVLVSVLYTFSTMASENEITALRASGVDLRRAALPLVVTAALIAAGMVWFNDTILPASNYRWRVLITDVAQTRPLLYLKSQTLNPIRTTDGTTPFYLEARYIDAGTGFLQDVAIYDVSDGRSTRTIHADSGRMAFNQDRTDLLLTLYDGSIAEVDFVEPSAYHLVDFKQQVMKIEGVSDRLERTMDSSYRTDRDMTVAMMQARIDSLRAERDTLLALIREVSPAGQKDGAEGSEAEAAAAVSAEAEAALREAAMREAGRAALRDQLENSLVTERPEQAEARAEPAEYTEPNPENIRYSMARVDNLEYQIREYQVEIHKKYSIAFATLVFVLIGIPLALRFPSGGIGMVIAVSLSIFGIYYVGLIGGENLGNPGYVPPAVAMWATNTIFGVLGAIGFVRLGREHGTARNQGWGELPRWLRVLQFRRAQGTGRAVGAGATSAAAPTGGSTPGARAHAGSELEAPDPTAADPTIADLEAGFAHPREEAGFSTDESARSGEGNPDALSSGTNPAVDDADPVVGDADLAAGEGRPAAGEGRSDTDDRDPATDDESPGIRSPGSDIGTHTDGTVSGAPSASEEARNLSASPDPEVLPDATDRRSHAHRLDWGMPTSGTGEASPSETTDRLPRAREQDGGVDG